MTTASPQDTARYRLAHHYLNKLRSADTAYRHGQFSSAYGLTLFDQEWEQIRHWQAWAAERRTSDQVSARLCLEFPLVGLEVLANRNNAADQAVWLKAALESAQQLHHEEAACTLYYELAMTYYRLGVLEEVEYLASQLLALGERRNDSLSIERAVLLLGLFAEDSGRYSEAELHYQRALRLAVELGIDDETGRALNGLGAIALYRGDYVKAYRYLSRQLKLMEATGKKYKICHAMISLGRVLIELKEYERAEECLQYAVNMCRTLGFRRLMGVGLLNLGSAAARQNQLEVARSYFEEGLQVVRSTNTQRQIIRGLTMLGDTSMRLGELSAASAHLREGLSLARDVGLPRHICDLQHNLANTYLAMNDPEAARIALHEALSLAQSLDSRPQKAESVLSSIAYFQRLGWYEQTAVWAGAIWDETSLDQFFFAPVCHQIERALGREAFQQALAQGKAQLLDDIVTKVLEIIATPGHPPE
jgi:tetratricopeptide (TPR) repeat protein